MFNIVVLTATSDPTVHCGVFCITTAVINMYPFLVSREILVLSDGGEVAFDWAIAKGSPDQEDRAKPVLHILPGHLVVGIYIVHLLYTISA